MSTSSEKDISVAFEKLSIAHSDLNANININISHFKPKILERLSIIWKVLASNAQTSTQYLISLPGQLLLI